MKFGTQSGSIADLDPKLRTGLKIAICLKSNMIIMNIVLGIDALDPKL